MADLVLSDLGARYPEGTTLELRAGDRGLPGGDPIGPALDTAVVASRTATFTDVDPGRYLVSGLVGGSWLSVSVSQPEVPLFPEDTETVQSNELRRIFDYLKGGGQLDGLTVGPAPKGSDTKKYTGVGIYYDSVARKVFLEGIANVLETDDTPEVVGKRVKGDYATRTPAICQLDGSHAASAGTFTVTLPTPAPYTRTTDDPTKGFSSSGRFVVRNPTTTRVAKIAYTGLTADTFTGCTVIAENGSGDFDDGAQVTGLLLDQTTLMNIYPMPFTDWGGTQERGSAIGMILAEDAWYDGRGYSTGSELVHTLMSLGPDSQRVRQFVENTQGFFVMLGDAAPTALESGRQGAFRLHIGGPFTRVSGAQTFPLTDDRLLCRHTTTGFPSAGGNISIGGVTGYSYTGKDGRYLTGCTGPGGAVADAGAIRLEDPFTSAAADGRVSARQGRASQVRIGDEGPSREAGVSAGSAADTVLHRAAAGVWQPDLFRWKAANVQTTVGAAGGASSVPATPDKYMKVQDSDGTVLVVPAFAAS